MKAPPWVKRPPSGGHFHPPPKKTFLWPSTNHRVCVWRHLTLLFLLCTAGGRFSFKGAGPSHPPTPPASCCSLMTFREVQRKRSQFSSRIESTSSLQKVIFSREVSSAELIEWLWHLYISYIRWSMLWIIDVHCLLKCLCLIYWLFIPPKARKGTKL